MDGTGRDGKHGMVAAERKDRPDERKDTPFTLFTNNFSHKISFFNRFEIAASTPLIYPGMGGVSIA